jgi:PAS domain S-box-containing protein
MRFRVLLPHGSLRYIEAAYGTILNEAGEVVRMVGAVIDVTERRVAEERFQLVVEAAPNAMIMVNAEGRMTLVNTQVEKLFGYDRDELLGQNIGMLVPRSLRSRHGDHLARFFAEPATKAKRLGRELPGLRRDGSEVTMEIALNPVHSAEGQFVLVSIVDVSERRKTDDRALLLAAVIDGAKEYGIFMLDPEGHVLTWNEGAARIKGYSEAEIVGRHFSVFYPNEDIVSGFPDNELRIARAEGKFEAEGWRTRRDGSRFWATVLITALRDKEGNLRGFSKFTRDTTERRRTEERFQLVVEASPSAMIIIGADGRITLVNNQTEKLFGYDRSELLGQHIEMLVPERFRSHHPGHRDMFFAAPVARAMGAGRDLFGVRKDAGEVPIEIGLSPISTADGQFVLASIIDITERKRFETALQAKSAEMERFTYTVSHDLKSPIITIKSYISMIEQDLTAGKLDRTRADLQRVARAADRMQMLLEEVLALSRVGRVENTSETVAFGTLVDEALELVAGRIQQANIHVEVGENLPSVTVDSRRMVEVLQNLIDNAGKFMGSQPAPRILIGSLVAGTDDGPETRFFVKDNGIGLEERHHKRIFGLFDKLNPKSEGSGAGLAIVKRIIELQGGRIWVESPEGGIGSTFWFTLPAGASC